MSQRHVFRAIPTEITIYRVFLRTSTHNFIVEFEPFPVEFWINKNNVMTTVIVATVYENSVECVCWRCCLGLLEERRQVDVLLEFVAIVDFYVRVCLRVVLEAH